MKGAPLSARRGWVEMTVGLWVGSRCGCGEEGGEGFAAVGVHGGGGGKELAGVGMLGGAEDVGNGGLLDDAAALHDGDAVGNLRNDGEVVGDEEHSEAVGMAEGAKEIEDLGLNGDVEGGGGLVGDEEAGAIGESDGDEDALALATGELVWVVGEAALGFGEGDLVEGGEGAGFDVVTGKFGVVGADGFSDLGADLHDGIEGGHGLLEDHGDITAAEAAQGGFGFGEEVAVVELDLAGEGGGGREEAEEGERGGGLAGAGFTDEAEGFAGGEGEGDAVDGRVRAEADGEVGDFQKRGHVWGDGSAGGSLQRRFIVRAEMRRSFASLRHGNQRAR